MNSKRNGLLLAALLGALALGYLLGRSRSPETPPAAPPAAAVPGDHADRAGHAAEAEEIWTCAMHPQIRLPKPGKCPICGMDLIRVARAPAAEESPRRLAMTEEAMRLAEIETAPVVRRAAAREVRMVGKIAYDETRLGTISVRAAGRIDKLHVDFVGAPVAKGQVVADLYSPELVSAQAELIEAVRAAGEADPEASPLLRRMSEETARAARTKLRLLGLSDAQIASAEKRGAPAERIAVRADRAGVVVERIATEGMYVAAGDALYKVADLGRVWALLSAYESDLPWLRPGQTAAFTSSAIPGETFAGRIAFIDPSLDPMTRTARVRVEAENPGGRLRPETFVDAVVKAEAEGEPPLTIPATAPLLTGERAVVYVRVPDAPTPAFEGREVTLGARGGEDFIVLSGLREGEEVVVRGAFRIDSDLQIRARPSMMAPQGGAAPAHQH